MIKHRTRWFAFGILIGIAVWSAALAREPPAARSEASRRVSDMAEEKALRELEERLNKAVVDGDVATFDQLFADDFTHTSQNGRFRTRAEWMKGRVQGKSNYVSFDVEGVQIRFYGETAVVTGLSKPSWREDDGSLANGRFRFLRVWAKRGGRWQVVAFQGTRISDE
jgi:ketosteroid isomerase-like protein